MARTLALALLACLPLLAGAQELKKFAAESKIPDAPSAVIAAATEPAAPHKFFDRLNLALTAGNLTAQIADAVTTQHLLSRSGTVRYREINGNLTPVTYYYTEANPVARPFATRGWGGAVAYLGIVTSADLSLRYMFHRTGHHKLERVVPMVFGAVSGMAASRNAAKY